MKIIIGLTAVVAFVVVLGLFSGAIGYALFETGYTAAIFWGAVFVVWVIHANQIHRRLL